MTRLTSVGSPPAPAALRVRGGRAAHARRGHTLIEVTMVLGLFVVVSYAITVLLQSTMLTAVHSETWANLSEWAQRGINGVGSEFVALRKIYQNDAFGQLYLNNLEAPASWPRLANGRLPVCDDAGTLHTDTIATPRTGNLFLFCKQQAPFSATLALGAGIRRVDLYTLVLFYLSSTARPMGPYAQSLVLARWESVVYADYGEVMAFPAVERTQVVAQLFAAGGVRHLWNTGNSVGTAFYAIDGGGNIAGAADPLYRPVGATNTNVIPNLGFGAAGIAFNRTEATWVKEAVPVFALMDGTGAGFPHGFEVQVTGPTGARSIALRLVVAYWVVADRSLDSLGLTLVANAREF